MEKEHARRRGLDYYGALKLTKVASDEEIKDAYRFLALQYNPVRNKNPDLEPLFELVGEAFEVLSDPLLKSIYDQFGEEGLKKGVWTPHGWREAWQYHREPLRTFKRFFGTSNPYADLIECMREQMVRFKSTKVDDVRVKQKPLERILNLTLHEVYFGTMKKMKIERNIFDKEKGTNTLEEKLICINIKPGTPEGTSIVFRNVGDEGPTKIPGDLIVTTKDIPHERFRRDGVNLHLAIHLDLKRAMGGLIVELNTIDCRIIRFAITDVVMPGSKKVIQNEGMPYYEDPFKKGDLIIDFSVEFPKYVSKDCLSKLLDALACESEKNDLSDEEKEEKQQKSEDIITQIVERERATLQQSYPDATPLKDSKSNVCRDFLDQYIFKV